MKTIILIYLTSFNVNGQCNEKARLRQTAHQTLSKMDREEDPLVEIFNNEINPCPTQEDFKQSFAHLKKIILKKGEKRRYEGDDYPTTFYTYNDMGFSYRNIAPESKYPMETILVSSDFNSYWIIKTRGTYDINVKDYSEEIAKQKRKAALEHFCTQLLNLKK